MKFLCKLFGCDTEIREVIKEVPVEVVREVIKEVPVQSVSKTTKPARPDIPNGLSQSEKYLFVCGAYGYKVTDSWIALVGDNLTDEFIELTLDCIEAMCDATLQYMNRLPEMPEFQYFLAATTADARRETLHRIKTQPKKEWLLRAIANDLSISK